MKIIVKNNKVLFNYDVLDKYEAGIVLKGWEVKSVKAGQINIKDGYVKSAKNEVWLHNIHIPRWRTQSRYEKIDTFRKRKLLLKKFQIHKLIQKSQIQGLSIVPIQVYISDNNKIKIEIAIVKGRKKYDKRQKLKEKDQLRQIDIELKEMDRI